MEKSTLEVTFIENGKPSIEIKSGNYFTVKTSDDFEIELFVFKEDNKIWNVVEPISSTCLSLGSTRYNAILLATEELESKNYNDFIKSVDKSLSNKEGLIKEN